MVLPKELPKVKFMATLTAIRPAEAPPTNTTMTQGTLLLHGSVRN
jgi:hypothetical protein